MQLVGNRYVQYINRRYGRTGTLWEGRHNASLTDAEDYLLACYRYIIKQLCTKNLASAGTRHGYSRQVSFIIKRHQGSHHYTDWMKVSVDSDKGK